mmetsp:Transcript_4684/g.7278  ORF Transcript_4684/g.7278 Transcript_4684/m.7278 type:complete len:99 (+) Transcript_4684:983-1279(+)
MGQGWLRQWISYQSQCDGGGMGTLLRKRYRTYPDFCKGSSVADLYRASLERSNGVNAPRYLSMARGMLGTQKCKRQNPKQAAENGATKAMNATTGLAM